MKIIQRPAIPRSDSQLRALKTNDNVVRKMFRLALNNELKTEFDQFWLKSNCLQTSQQIMILKM